MNHVQGVKATEPEGAARPCQFVIFGGTGDLALRKLIPALFSLYRESRLTPGTRLIAVSRKTLNNEAYRELLEERARIHVTASEFRPDDWEAFLRIAEHVELDASQPDQYTKLAAALEDDGKSQRVFYLATLPALYHEVCASLSNAGLVDSSTRLVLEKPLGSDLASAQRVNREVARVFDERQIFRIDHYLGKEPVQNLLALRFGNSIFEPLWRAAHVDYVEISVCETIGVEDRGGYYDRSGALRDMVQNHLLQLLCLTAMEPPVRFEENAVRNEKLKVLQALRPLEGRTVREKTVRGQYTASAVDGREVPAYYFEKGVSAESATETFVALKVEVDNWRWTGTPFYLRTGKRMSKRFSEIVVHFKPVAHRIFQDTGAPHISNRLVIQLQPDEGVELLLNTKIPGQGMSLHPAPLDLNLADAFRRRRWVAYERLLMDVLRGDSTLFVRADEIETAWSWIDPIEAGWEAHYAHPTLYKAGSMGPDRANELIERDGYQWHEALAADS